MTSTKLTIVLFSILASPTVSTQCYNPDGTPATSRYQPCVSDQPSMCCALNGQGIGVNSCRSDNLCADADNISLWRESCTDSTWKDPACLQLCVEGSGQGLIGSIDLHTRDSPLTTCSDGSICCGLRNDVCCSMKNGFWLINGTVYSYGTRPSGIPFTAPLVTGSTISSLNRDGTASTLSASANSQTGSITRLRLGLGIGLGVGIPILLAIMAGVLLHLRRRGKGVPPHHGAVSTHETARDGHIPQTSQQFRELDPNSNPKELSSHPDPRELDPDPPPGELDYNPGPEELDSNPVPVKPF